MSDINTNLSVSPYWDDYSAEKQFYKILFVPSRAVQVREINQVQTIIKHQISRFADHVFKDGSIVSGCNITYIPRLKYVRLTQFDNFNSNNAMSTSALNEFLVVSPTTGLRASIQLVEPGFTNDYPNTNMFFVNYLNKGRDVGNNEVSEFSPQETLSVYDRGQDKHGVLNPGLLYNTIETISEDVDNNIRATGDAYAVTVGDGIVYQKGYFVNVIPHTILVSKHDTETRGKMVGFETRESIVSYLQDQTLIDPVDTSNRNGRGADRLKLSPELVVKDRADISTTDDFFPIIEFSKEDLPVKQNTDPEYAKLGDYIAKQKSETNGDFYIKPFVISSKATSNTSNFSYTLDSGIAYVKGNRVHLLNTITLEEPRATTLSFTNNNIITLNYGNYIIINELSGTFNSDKLITADIYDEPQTAVTSNRTPGTVTGSRIGSASIRAVVFDSGSKGSPAAKYRLYVSDIIMDSGKSFVKDAKSFTVTAGNNLLDRGALGDIVLVNGKASLVDSSASGLLFPTGVMGTRRYRDNHGVNDTSYQFRDISSATLQANGSATFSLNTPYAGGSERFFASPGILTSANKLRIDITPSTNIVTSNLAGTVNGNSGNNTVTGTGTSFTVDFNPGEIIRIGATNYRIVNIASDQVMTVESTVTGGTTTDAYAKFYPAFSQLNLDKSTVTAVSNTQFIVSLDTNITSGAPQSLVASYPVIRGEAYEIKKEVRRDQYVKIKPLNSTGPYNLGLVDIFSIEAIYVGPTYSENNPNRLNWFYLDNGQQNTHYDHGKLILKPEFQNKIDLTDRILVKLNLFTSNTVAGVGFYTVDSYPTRAPGDLANTSNISYDDIPDVLGMSLRNVVDFRPQKYNTAILTNDPVAATENPAPANTSFNINLTGGSYLGEPDTNFTADIEYYLPRYDIIQVNKNGIFSVKSSIPSEKPKIPFTDNDSMILGTAYVPPYPGITADFNHLYSQSKPRIRTNLTGIRGYTMRDINSMDKRISTLEYYQTLSMLEQSAKDYSIKDENGLDRFKNGIFANPMKNHLLSDVSNYEYNIAIDEGNQLARPRFKKHNIDLDVDLNRSTNIKAKGRTATLDYTNEQLIDQPYATKYRNVVDAIWKWSGHMQLFPEYDHFRDETILPEVNVDIDLASPWEEFANSPFGTDFGEWRVTSQSSTFRDNTTRSGGGSTDQVITTTRTTTTTTNSSRDQYDLDISTSQTKYDLGSYVTDISLNPYMRSRQIAFVATGLTPNAKFWAYFANEPVSEFCAPGILDPSVYDIATNEISITSGKEDKVVIRTDEFGAQLTTDSLGNLCGIFNLPEDRFRVGDRQFVLYDVDDLTLGSDAILSSAAAVYTASALTTSTRDLSITTTEPSLVTRIATETKVDVDTTSAVIRRTVIPASPPSHSGGSTGGDGGSGPSSGDGPDPLGQSFYVDSPDITPGVFLESIEVFFRSKDQNMGITCYITEMVAGVPDASRVLATSYLQPSSVGTSNDSSLGTVFKFNDTPYLERDKYYTFFLQPDGNSPEYTLWVSDIGGVDVLTGVKIFSNPYVGVIFKSANSNTWDAIQTEDIKFKLNICSFAQSGSIMFNEQEDEYLSVEGFTMANTQTHIQVGDFVYSATGGVPDIGASAPFGIVQEVDTANDTLTLDSSRGGFAANTIIQIYRPSDTSDAGSINPTSLIASARVTNVDDVEYSIIVPKISTTTPAETSVSYYYRGTDTNNVVDPNWFDMMEETELEFVDKVRVIKSKSNRINTTTKSSEMRLDLMSNNRYLSPIINLRRRSLYAIDNIINDDVTNEHTRHGNALARYISPMITLAEGQDAEDIRVLATAYRPTDTEVRCYAKILSGDDGDNFHDKLWTELVMIEGESVRSSTTDPNDFREFVYAFPTEEVMQGTAYTNIDNLGIVQYRNSSGAVYVGYKSFSIKFVLTSKQKQRVPRLSDFRGMAIQI